MIGQQNILRYIDNAFSNNKFPKFLVIRGPKGSGKKQIVKYIGNKFGCDVLYFETSVDSVRQLIATSYQQTKQLIYVITDAEKLSNTAENALLKVVEEPPKNCYIILTTNADSLLTTINSRATTLCMAEYSREDLIEFAKKELNTDISENKLLDICNTPGDVINIASEDRKETMKEMITYCQNVVNLIGKANIGSALKITFRVAVREKNADNFDLFDLNLFLKLLNKLYEEQCTLANGNPQQFKKYYDCWEAVFNAQKQISKNYNKQYILDELLLKLRKVSDAAV